LSILVGVTGKFSSTPAVSDRLRRRLVVSVEFRAVLLCSPATFGH